MDPAVRSFHWTDFILEVIALFFIFSEATSISVLQFMLEISKCGNNATSTANSTLVDCATIVANRTAPFQQDVPLRDVILNIPTIGLLCSVLICVLLGPWSDWHGRKLHIVLPILGALVKTGSSIAFILTEFVHSVAIYVLTVSAGLLGGANLFAAGCLCFISDNSDYRTRTLRFGGLSFVLYVGQAAAIFSERYWKSILVSGTPLAYVVGLVLCAQLVFELICLIVVLVWVKESLRILPGYNGHPVWNVLSLHQLNKVLTVSLRKRGLNGRCFVIVLFTVFLLGRFIYCGKRLFLLGYA